MLCCIKKRTASPNAAHRHGGHVTTTQARSGGGMPLPDPYNVHKSKTLLAKFLLAILAESEFEASQTRTPSKPEDSSAAKIPSTIRLDVDISARFFCGADSDIPTVGISAE